MVEEFNSNEQKISKKHGQSKAVMKANQSQKNLDHEHTGTNKKGGKVKPTNDPSTDQEYNAIKKKKQKMKPKKKIKEIKPKDEKLLKKKALKYLKQWKKDRNNWKFEKLRQIWLLQNMFDVSKVPEKKFPLLLDYIRGAKGQARVFVRNKAQETVQTMEQWTELANQGLEETEISSKCPNLEKISEESYSRARLVLQSFREEPND